MTDDVAPTELDLGPFRLAAPFARGAMGEVWKAWHRDQRLPVALKVLTGEYARDERYVRDFHDEVRAIAGLDHPHVVTLLDAGTLDERAEQRSGGRLVAGSPWLAMEYASDGTVRDRPPTTWPAIRGVLLATLAALAHAHARGVIHRDLKPANLLVCGALDPRPGLKLSDFGIAARFGGAAGARRAAGTPHYMAPEQLSGAELGPWTDLYSLGVLTWRLVTGRLPFSGLERRELVQAHQASPLPRFLPGMEVPAGLSGWVHALLAKRPQDRPQRAADAAAALVALEATDDDAARGWLDLEDRDADTIELAREDLMQAEVGRSGESLAAPGMGPPPQVPDWREQDTARPPALLGAGLGLFGLRDPPIVGRTEQQDQLWSELREVHRVRRPRLVVIHGSTGAGKTRLATWLCRRADEVGAARVLWSEARQGDAGGLVPKIARMLRCEGLTREERHERLVALLRDRDRATAAAALLDGTLPEGARGEVTASLLCAAASERPVVVCLDEAHRAEEDLDACAAVLRRDRPVLLVLVVEEDALAERPHTRARIGALAGARVLVGPLSPLARRELVEGLLLLDHDLAIQVESRAEGNPLFAVHLVGDWVQRGWLVAGPKGFVLRPDVRGALVLPDDLHAVWLRRLQRVLSHLAPSAGWDLEVAAALGPDVEEWAWHTACDDPDGTGVGWEREGVSRRNMLRDRLIASRMAAATPGGLTFLPQPRQCLVRWSQERGRWPAVCLSAAGALRARGPGGGRAGRVGHLLVQARRPVEALPYYLEAVSETQRTSTRRALALLVEAEEAARRAGLPDDDPSACALRVGRARVHLAGGEPEEALRHAREALRWAFPRASSPREVDPTWAKLAREALEAELGAHLVRRDATAAHRTLDELGPLVYATRDAELVGALLSAEAGLVARDPSRRDEAERLLEQAVEWHRRGRVRPEAAANLTLSRALLARELGRNEAARELLEAGLEQLGDEGSRHTAAQALCALAEVHLWARRTELAEQVARRALSVFDSLGNPGIEARLALGLALSAAGRSDAAREELARARRDAADQGRTELEGLTGLATALAAARVGRWSEVSDRLRDAERHGPPHDALTRELRQDLAAVCAGHEVPPRVRTRVAALLR